MEHFVNKDKLQEFATKLHNKQKTIFASKTDVGSPLVASTVADMTDTDKIYVYVGSETGYTAGNWYYYNGTAWVSGGIYNSQGIGDGSITLAKLASDIHDDVESIPDISADLDDIKDAFNYENQYLNLSTATSGWIDDTGEIQAPTATAVFHRTVTVDASLVGVPIYVSGNSWWAMQPYVFVASDSTIVTAGVPSPSGTVTKCEDLKFVSSKQGTLYINYHTDNPACSAYIVVLNSLKNSKLASNVGEYINTVNSYEKMEVTIITGKYLNANNGAITDVQNEAPRITDYIPVIAGMPYLITTQNFYGQGLYVFYDEDKNYISGRASEGGSTFTKLMHEKVIAPNNAAYLVVAEWYLTNFPNITVYEGHLGSIAPSSKWSGKKWVCVGDSLTERNTTAVYRYYDAVASATGITPYVMGVSGTGYARGSENSNAFYQRVSSVPADADVITIFGSFNDIGAGLSIGDVDDTGTETIAGCINTTIDNILAVNPIANIGIVAPCPWGSTQPTESGFAYNYVTMIEKICKRRSIPYLDLWHGSGLMPWNEDFAAIAYSQGDVVHPNDVGHSILASKFKAFLETLLV